MIPKSAVGILVLDETCSHLYSDNIMEAVASVAFPIASLSFVFDVG